MTLEELMKALYPQKAKEMGQDWCELAQRTFQEFIQEQEIIRVYFDDSPNYGHQAHTVLLMRRLIFDCAYTGTFELVVPNDDLDSTLALLLPGYNRDKTFYFYDCSVTVCTNIDTDVKFGICGGCDYNREDFNLARLINAQFAVCIQPYMWNVQSAVYINSSGNTRFININELPVLYHDTMITGISGTIIDPFEHSENGKKALNLIVKKEDLCIWPVYGMHVVEQKKGTQTVAVLLLNLTLAALLSLQTHGDKPLVMVLLNYNDLKYCDDKLYWYTLLNMLAEGNIEKACMRSTLETRFSLKDEQAIDYQNVLMEIIQKFGINHSKLQLCTHDDLPQTLEKGNLYIYPLGPVPQLFYDQIFYYSEFPPVFEGQGTSSLALHLGRPFIQGSVTIEANNYPYYINTNQGQQSLDIYQLVKALFEPYYVNIIKEVVDTPELIKQLTALMLSTWSGGPWYEYFQDVGRWAKDPANDKLLLGFLHGLKFFKDEQKSPHPKPEENGTLQEGWTLQNIYEAWKQAAETGTASLSEIVPQSLFARYASLLNQGAPVLLQIKPEQISCQREGEALTEVTVSGAVGELPVLGTIQSELRFTQPADTLEVEWRAATEHAAYFSALPWLKLEESGFILHTYESYLPCSCYATGRLAGTTLQMEIDVSKGPMRFVRGEFPEPVGTMDTFFALAGGVDFVNSLPVCLRELGGFGLKRVEFVVDETNGRVDQMLFVLQTDHPWQFCSGVDLSFLPQVTVFLQDPQSLQTRNLWFEIGGQLQIGGGTLMIGGRYPDFQVEMVLSEGKIDLSEVAKLFSLDLDLQTDVTTLYLLAAPEAQTYQARLLLETDWAFFGLFTITGIGVELQYANQAAAFSLFGSLRFLPQSRTPLDLSVSAAYQSGQWQFRAVQTVSQNVSLEEVLHTYTGNALSLQREQESDVELCRLEVCYATGSEDYCISAQTAQPWEIPFLELSVEAGATVGRKDSAYFARIQAEVEWQQIPLLVWYDYSQSGPYSHSFGFTWDVLSGTVSKDSASGEWVGTLSVAAGTTLGSIIEHMLTWCTGAPFELDAPWNLLSAVPLPACVLVYHFTTGTVSLQVQLGPIEMGFATIEGISLSYQSGRSNPEENGVMVNLVGSFVWNTGDEAVGDQHNLGPWNAAQPGSAPAPGGQGNKYVDLRLFALGQHAHIFGAPVKNVEEAMEQLYALAPAEEGALPPVAYSAGTGWLVGADLGILRENEGREYLLNLQLLFNDPELYALRVRLEGTAAKVFQGLEFQVLYQKISDTLGVFRSEITLPDHMRHLGIGAYGLTLPVFGFSVYTNGDFQVDFGFPWNQDFSRSFSVEAVVYPGIPIIGAAGFYFAKLSSDTAQDLVPQADNGLFNPVIAFGFGLSVGVGKSIHYGILSGGFSVTVFGILEGVIAKWNPYVLPGQTDDNLQSSYYFSIHGTVGLMGSVFGEVDFAIIKAAVNVGIEVYVDFRFASYENIALTVAAAVRASASLTLNLGLFKLHISFSFSIQVKETLTIRTSGTAPWHTLQEGSGVLRSAGRLRALRGPVPPISWKNQLLPEKQPRQLRGYLLSAPTAAADEWGGGAIPCLSLMLSVDAAEDCFGALCDAVARWCVCCGLGQDMTAEQVDECILTEDVAQGLAQALKAFSDGLTPLPEAQIDQMLSGQFRLRLVETNRLLTMGKDGESAQGAFFPIPPALHVKAPKLGGVEAVDYTFGDYNALSNEALAQLRALFAQLSVQFEDSEGKRGAVREEATLSVASWLYSDYFLLLGRQMTRALLDALRNLQYPLVSGQCVRNILDWVQERRGSQEDTLYTVYDLFASNPDHLLTPGKHLSVGGQEYETVQGDTLALVAGRFNLELTALADGADGEKNAALVDLFDCTEKDWLNLPHLGSFRVAELLAEARRSGIYNTLSGMVSRYYLHGLRLPTDGITPKTGGMWVQNGKLPPEAGLFALTGQLLPAPVALTEPYTISFTCESGAPAWLDLPQSYDLTITPSGIEARQLEVLAAFLKTGTLQLDCARLDETTFHPASWSFGPPAALGESGKLWTLPTDLQTMQMSQGGTAVSLFLGRYDEATGQMASTPLSACQYAALVSFRVRRTDTEGLYTVFCGRGQTPRRLEGLLEVCRKQPQRVTGLRLLYQTEGGYTYDPPETCSFDLLQIDLSTQSHPPVEGNQNEPPVEALLELLWQALVTNNGGTTLYYWAQERDAGLPTQIFSEDGDAELAFLVTLAQDGGQVPLWSDCVVSAATIPAGAQLTAVCREQLYTLSDAGQSPAELAAAYGGSVTDLARRCGNVHLLEGSRWTVCNALYPACSQGEPGLNPQKIADYFGVSVKELEEANRWKADWETPFQECDPVLIPPFEAVAGADETLCELAQRCFVPASTLLWQNREKQNRFRPGETVTLNACPGSYYGALVAGCVNDTFQRTEPADVPEDPDHPDYARLLLENRFTLLRYQVAENPWYSGSTGSVPVSPDHNWRFAFSFPAATYCGQGTYGAVGTVSRRTFQWLDLYGNRLDTHLAAMESQCLVGYTDGLVAFSRYPSCAMVWYPDGDGEHPAIVVCLNFSAERYHTSGAEGKEEAGQDLALFQTAAAQLADPVGVTMSLRTSLLQTGSQAVPDGGKQLLDYLNSICTFLTARAAGQDAAAPDATVELRIPLALEALCTQPLFQVEVSVELRRSGGPMAGYEEVAGITAVENSLTPDSDDLEAFARRFETAFPNLTLAMFANSSAGALYALRKEEKTGDGGLAFTFHPETEDQIIYTPRPVSNRLESRSGVNVYRYTPGTMLSEKDVQCCSFQDVDLNAWLRELLEAVDQAFTPESAMAARQLERLSGEESYQELVEAKRSLAQALSALLVPVFSDQQPQWQETAQEQFYQNLLCTLGNFYDMRAIILYPADTRSQMPAPFGRYPRLYGTLDIYSEEGAAGVKATSAKLPLGPEEKQVMAVSIQAPNVVRGAAGEILPSLTLTGQYQPTHLEYDIRCPQDLGGYEDSGWLRLLLPESYQRELGQIPIPLPLTTYPQTPTLPEQECMGEDELWMWRYRFDYTLDIHYPQSTLHCAVRFNESGANRKNDQDGLFVALARCHTVCNALLKDIANVPPMGAEIDPGSKEAATFSAALRSLALLGREAASALSTASSRHVERGLCQEEGDLYFTLRESAGEQGELMISVEGASGVEVLVEPEQYTMEQMGEGVYRYRDKETGDYLLAAQGQTIPRRTVCLPPESLFLCQSARAILYIEQNGGLVPGREVADCFRFNTGQVTFPEPCFPVKEVTQEVDLSIYLGRTGTIQEHLDAFFATLPEGTDALFQVQASYCYCLEKELPLVEVPIFFQTQVRITRENYTDYTKDWADALASWRRDQLGNQEWTQTEKLQFTFTILSRLTPNPTPMLTIKRAVLPGGQLLNEAIK